MFTVVGFKKIISKKDSTRFTELHLVSEDRFVLGQRVDAVFVRDDSIENIEFLEVGSDVQLIYNRYGRVEKVVIVV